MCVCVCVCARYVGHTCRDVAEGGGVYCSVQAAVSPKPSSLSPSSLPVFYTLHTPHTSLTLHTCTLRHNELFMRLTSCNKEQVVGIKCDERHWQFSEIQLESSRQSVSIHTRLQVCPGICREGGRKIWNGVRGFSLGRAASEPGRGKYHMRSTYLCQIPS